MGVYIADIDKVGSEMERPFWREYVNGEDEQEAREAAERLVADTPDEVVRGVRPLQPILDRILAGPGDYSISWKDEGRYGPVWITNHREAGDGPQAVPFGSEFPGVESLPWQTRAEARRLAKYLGLKLETS